MLFLVLEACAVTRACLDGQAYEKLCRHPELRTLEETGRHVLSELATAVGVGRGTAIAEDEPGRDGVPTVEEPARWRQRYQGMFLRDKDWAQVVKTNHYLPIIILLWGGEFEERSV